METEMRDEEPRERKRQMEDQSAALNTKHVCNAPYQVSGSNGNLNLMHIIVSVCWWCCQWCLCVYDIILPEIYLYFQGELKLCLQSLTHQSKYPPCIFSLSASLPHLLLQCFLHFLSRMNAAHTPEGLNGLSYSSIL